MPQCLVAIGKRLSENELHEHQPPDGMQCALRPRAILVVDHALAALVVGVPIDGWRRIDGCRRIDATATQHCHATLLIVEKWQEVSPGGFLKQVEGLDLSTSRQRRIVGVLI